MYLINVASCVTSKVSIDSSRANKYHCTCGCLTRSLANSSVRLVLFCLDNGTYCSLPTVYFLLRNIVFASSNKQDFTRSAGLYGAIASASNFDTRKEASVVLFCSEVRFCNIAICDTFAILKLSTLSFLA